jgi:hypothetical protein
MAYNANQIFSNVELTYIAPTDVERCRKYRAYGDPEPGPDARPTKLRGSTLLLAKKEISFFIPNRLRSWDPGRCTGNPSKLVQINNLLKAVAKHECRAEGAQCQVKRALTRVEFVKALHIFEAKDSFFLKHRIPTMMKYQCHLLQDQMILCTLKLQTCLGTRTLSFNSWLCR